MRPLFVEGADEVVEASLLLQEILGGRLGGFLLQCQMQACVPSLGSTRGGGLVPSDNNWLDPLVVVAICLLVALVLNQVLPSLRSSRRGSWVRSIIGLLAPVIVVACLFACQSAYGRHITLAIGYLGLFAFIVFIPLFRSFDLPDNASSRWTRLSGLPAACSRVLVRWGVIVAAVLFLAFAFNVGTVFSRKVMLTWFMVTPVALCLLQAVRLHTR